MVAHAILFIVLPLTVAWVAGVTAYLPPYSLPPARKTDPVEPQFEAEVRAFLAQHIEPDAAAIGRPVSSRSHAPDRCRIPGRTITAAGIAELRYTYSSTFRTSHLQTGWIIVLAQEAHLQRALLQLSPEGFCPGLLFASPDQRRTAHGQLVWEPDSRRWLIEPLRMGPL